MSANTDQVLELERRLWREANNPEFIRGAFADDGYTVLEPVGLIDKERGMRVAAHTKPWDEVHMTDVVVRELAPNCVLLTYRGRALREGDAEPYTTRITSVYLLRDGTWQLVVTSHQPWDPKESAALSAETASTPDFADQEALAAAAG